LEILPRLLKLTSLKDRSISARPTENDGRFLPYPSFDSGERGGSNADHEKEHPSREEHRRKIPLNQEKNRKLEIDRLIS